jgi:oxygen-independent coproporphyrinogen-3 oxidase
VSLPCPRPGFGLYVHWPYCTRICPYCDFNVYAAKDRDPAVLLDAVAADIRAHAQAFRELEGPLDSVFLGGGTPSLLGPAQIAGIVETAHAGFGLGPGAEITLEANPRDVLRADLEGWRAAGVTRLSIGVQSLDDAALAFLGRDHDAAAARAAVARALPRFASVSIDLIYARPGQSRESWADELQAALALGAPHLSLYELTIAERTVFEKRVRRGEIQPMPDDDQAALYELTQSITERAGLPAYEISNHAAGPQHRSVHNMIYWQAGDWIGVGPGAHGRLTTGQGRIASLAHRRPEAYVTAAASGQPAWASHERLSPLDTAREALAMGLRVESGVDTARIETLAGRALDTAALEDMQANGLLRLRGGRASLTPQGRLLADRVAAEIAP